MANATTLTLAAGVEQHVSSTVYYSEIVVTNTEDTHELYVRTDSGVASVEGADCEVVPPNSMGTFGNLLPLPDEDNPVVNPATRVSVISAGSPDVTVALQ
jgi:hypothetical protein